MIEDIKFYCKEENKDSLLERIEISSGVELAIGYDIFNNRKYKEESYKPKDDWRKLNESEKKILITNNTTVGINDSLAIINISLELKSIIDEIGFLNINSYEDFSTLFVEKKDLFNEFKLELANFLKPVIIVEKPLSSAKLLCFSYENPKIETIAYDQNDDEYFGLHLDSSEGNSIVDRRFNKNRLSINIGREPRYLLYVNVGIESMIKLISEKYPDISEKKNTISDRELVNLFFKYFPNYPVIRVKQNSLEAYIAPTDNVIHDGSTIDKKFPDMTIVLTGYFNTIL